MVFECEFCQAELPENQPYYWTEEWGYLCEECKDMFIEEFGEDGIEEYG